MANGAMNQDPTQQGKAAPNPQRLQRRIDYLQKRNPRDPRLRQLQTRLKNMGGAQPQQPGEPAQPAPFEQLNPQQQMQRLGGVGGNIFERMGEYAEQFDPRTMQSSYEPIYSQEMERARQNVMGQFERRMAPEFERQNQDFAQMAAERGLDPNSPAYQTLAKQLADRQDLARQEAMSAAEQAAQGVQTQLYNQATGLATLPGQIAGQFLTPFQLQQQQAELARQRKFEAQQAEKERQARLQQARIGASAGGQGTSAYDRWLESQIAGGYGEAQTPNPFAGAAEGFAGGFGQGFFS